MNKLKNLIEINHTIAGATHEFYRNAGLTYVDVPEIVGITGACENVDTLFKVGSRLNIPLFFTQTGQLSLEQALQHIPGAYTIIHSGRDEEIEDQRHLRQFRLIEEEFDWSLVAPNETYNEEKMYEALLQHIESVIKYICKTVIKIHSDLLDTSYKRDSKNFLASLEKPFWRISYDDAVKLLQKNGFSTLAWGDDLKTEHEAKIIELLNKDVFLRPVFIMKYPKEIKFFNMKVSEKDSRIVLSTDLILPYSGETVGSAVREHDGKKLTNRLISSTMFRLHKERGGDLEDFRWYLNIVNGGTTLPHAGYGIGTDRLMQYLLGEKDIRKCSTFYSLNQETGDWKDSHLTVNS